jgi:hypothetical protein
MVKIQADTIRRAAVDDGELSERGIRAAVLVQT